MEESGAEAAAARAGLDEQSHSPAAHVEERCWGAGLTRAVGALSVKMGKEVPQGPQTRLTCWECHVAEAPRASGKSLFSNQKRSNSKWGTVWGRTSPSGWWQQASGPSLPCPSPEETARLVGTAIEVGRLAHCSRSSGQFAGISCVCLVAEGPCVRVLQGD